MATPVRITDATVEPLTLEQAKLQCRVDGTDEDELIEQLIPSARQLLEEKLQRTLIETTWELQVPAFCSLQLPMPPLISLDSVKYLDTSAVEQTLAPANYVVDRYATPPCLRLAYGASWPAVAPGRPDAVRVRYRAGYGVAAADVPAPLVLWIKRQISYWYDNRGAEATREAMPYADALISGFRVIQF